eukprot:gb/GECG01009122.1/.p1 GENE.gb/GECG01009122.1/~~gb/GECG01009122.1/.p1  ORF type:complete len:524 (+),score=55.91 gb/GECG01009122.1/:1-1572(+)
MVRSVSTRSRRQRHRGPPKTQLAPQQSPSNKRKSPSVSTPKSNRSTPKSNRSTPLRTTTASMGKRRRPASPARGASSPKSPRLRGAWTPEGVTRMLLKRKELADRFWGSSVSAPKKQVFLRELWARVAGELNQTYSPKELRPPAPPDGDACQQKHYQCLLQIQSCATGTQKNNPFPAWARNAEVLLHLLSFPQALPPPPSKEKVDPSRYTNAAAHAVALFTRDLYFGDKNLEGWTLTNTECKQIVSSVISTRNQVLVSGKAPKVNRVNDWLETIMKRVKPNVKEISLSQKGELADDSENIPESDRESRSGASDNDDADDGSTSDTSEGIESLKEESSGDNPDLQHTKHQDHGASANPTNRDSKNVLNGELSKYDLPDGEDVKVISPKKYMIFRKSPFSDIMPHLENEDTRANLSAMHEMPQRGHSFETAPYGVPSTGAEKRMSDALLQIIKHERLTEKEREILTLAQLAMELAKYRPFVMGVAKLACPDNHHLHVGAFIHLVANRMHQLEITFSRIATDLTKY